ncbi:unnamed protein product [Clonostachys solani]|uniref:lytic cellulose monooxygenase (C4-dehydrogenating) n=1 Tax=Clonostachys solani TaxID=160281 RepID=A0A9N9ZHH2_9HYPO|nr:unnamed protein product [Clonostachys solani]
MKASYILPALGLLNVNDALQGSANTYIRKHQNSYMPTKFKNPPTGSITPLDADFSCNKGAVPASKVYSVKAGDKIGLKQAYGGTGMQHPGPAQVYMSPVADATTADGSGDWYKVHQALICTAGSAESLRSTAWCSWDEDQVYFTVPATIPNGQYLVRGEHIGLHGAHAGEAEFFYACAQVEVTGNSASSMPGQAVKIPGVYTADDAAVNFSVWGSSTSYNAIPGPDVIPGGTVRGSSDGASGDKVETVSGGVESNLSTSASAAATSTKAASASSTAVQTIPTATPSNSLGACSSFRVRRHRSRQV